MSTEAAAVLAEAEAAAGFKLMITHVRWFNTAWEMPADSVLVKGFPKPVIVGVLLISFVLALPLILWIAYWIVSIGFTCGTPVFGPASAPPMPIIRYPAGWGAQP
jgi:hypothetical protein